MDRLRAIGAYAKGNWFNLVLWSLMLFWIGYDAVSPTGLNCGRAGGHYDLFEGCTVTTIDHILIIDAR